MRHLIVVGAPGSGKSTLAARLAERLGLAHLNLGSLLREIAEEDSPLGREVGAPVAEGGLVSDDVAEQVIRERLAALAPDEGFVLDGYPRTASQADALHRVLADLGRLDPRPTVVQLDVPRDELLRRLARRGELEGRRDDSDEAIARRLQLDDAQRAPVLDALSRWADLVPVNGDQPAEAVTEQVLQAVPCRG